MGKNTGRIREFCQSGKVRTMHVGISQTRMHSRGMRTARLLTVSQHALGRGCVSQHASSKKKMVLVN